jgi:hypothetical protein
MFQSGGSVVELEEFLILFVVDLIAQLLFGSAVSRDVDDFVAAPYIDVDNMVDE